MPTSPYVWILSWQLEIGKQTLRTILMTFSFPHGRLYPEECEKKIKFMWRIEGNTDISNWYAQEFWGQYVYDLLTFLYRRA